TRLYVRPVLAAMRDVQIKGMSHITGGGLVENIPRCLPPGMKAVLQESVWPRLEIFDWLQREGQVPTAEMHRAFNCGIGFVLIVAAEDSRRVTELLQAQGEAVYCIGRVEVRRDQEAPTQII
ncbi:MAG: AIR synthase-related protein, partial [Burkholderiaceae bacterium]|nr:AIR synthase-related protein [Burkholderiaceae bacterium]